MTLTKPLALVPSLTVGLLVLVLAGCGGSASAQTPTAANGQPATLGVASSDLGDILVNSTGRTLLPVPEGLRHPERMHGRLRGGLAAAP